MHEKINKLSWSSLKELHKFKKECDKILAHSERFEYQDDLISFGNFLTESIVCAARLLMESERYLEIIEKYMEKYQGDIGS